MVVSCELACECLLQDRLPQTLGTDAAGGHHRLQLLHHAPVGGEVDFVLGLNAPAGRGGLRVDLLAGLFFRGHVELMVSSVGRMKQLNHLPGMLILRGGGEKINDWRGGGLVRVVYVVRGYHPAASNQHRVTRRWGVERAMGIEPTCAAWKVAVQFLSIPLLKDVEYFFSPICVNQTPYLSLTNL